MIGDGINDSPAFPACGHRHRHQLRRCHRPRDRGCHHQADSLEELVTLKTIANALQHRVSSNYRFVLSFNSTLIALGALGILQPAASAMLHNLSTIGISSGA